MGNFKSFDPAEIDETLTRVVTHSGATYLMFPYINAIGPTPKFNSISHLIRGSTATLKDFHALSALVTQAGENAAWFISFNTPWLMHPAEAEKIKQAGTIPRGKRG